PELRIFDCTTFLHPEPPDGQLRVETGRELYQSQGHIPGAALIELQHDLSDPSNGLRFTMPAADELARMFAAIGVGDHNEVVLYSANDAWWATRVWWMLHALGFDRARVLDGGFRRWLAEGRPVSQQMHSYPACGPIGVRERPVFCSRESVLAALVAGDAVVLNCLRAEQHDGSAQYHYGRPGHITGSINAPAASLFDAQGRFLPADALQAFFASRGIDKTTNVIAYCGGGIAATGDAFALTALLGYRSVSVYDNSLQEWAKDASLPMTTS
ncbi:MAG: rhodanese-like domain-containing protein, partial [Quisquiliibacterium sp.]